MAAPAHAEHMRGRSRPSGGDEAAAAVLKPPGLRDSALLRWAAFLGGLCLLFLALESMIGHYDESVVGVPAPGGGDLGRSVMPRELSRIRVEEPEYGELRVFLHVPTSGGRTLSDLANDVVPTWGTGIKHDFDAADRKLLAEACAWPTLDVFLHGHLCMNDVLRFGTQPCGRRRTTFVVVLREPLRRGASWLLHEAPKWLYDEFKAGEAAWSDFLRQEIENRLVFQIADETLYHKRDANASRVLRVAKAVLAEATVLYLSEVDAWMPAVAACAGRRSKHVKSRHLQDFRSLDDADRANVARLNALDVDLFAWVRDRKPHSDRWACLQKSRR